MRLAAVDDGGPGYAVRCTACRQAPIFGTIPLARLGISAARDSGLISWITSSLCRPVAVEAADVGEHQQLLGAQRDGQRGGGGVGVDVVDLAQLVGRDARDDGDPARPRSGRRTVSGRTLATSPTRPRSTSSPSTMVLVGFAVNSPASSPDSPTASGPCWLISPTSSRWTWPTSTIRTTSIASGVVTRRPPRNSDLMPSRSSIEEICGPPPCTTTGLNPAKRRNAMSSAKACFELGVGHRVAAVLHHDDLVVVGLQPRQRLGQGGRLRGVGFLHRLGL